MNGEGRGRRLDWGRSEGSGRGREGQGAGEGSCLLTLACVLKERCAGGGGRERASLLTLTRVSYVF